MWPALFVWNLFWWGLLCTSAFWLFDRFLPQTPIELVLAGVSALMLLNLDRVKPMYTAWTHLPSTSAFELTGLVYIRPFIPQVAIPLLLCYLGLQIRAFQTRGIENWLGMALLQFVTFATFPYATLVMIGITAIVGLRYFWADLRSALRILPLYVLICGLADIAFALHGHTPKQKKKMAVSRRTCMAPATGVRNKAAIFPMTSHSALKNTLGCASPVMGLWNSHCPLAA